jgi:hypothetical protein
MLDTYGIPAGNSGRVLVPDFSRLLPAASPNTSPGASRSEPDRAALKRALIAAGTGKDCDHPYCAPADVRDRATRKAQAAASLRRALSAKKPGAPGKRTAAQALRAALGRRTI